MDGSVLQFYDRLAGQYHLIFADWREAVRRQGMVLNAVINAHRGPAPLVVLDCSCGIGTQAIGLALHGHEVYATDLSPTAVAQARRHARSFGVADFRELAGRVFDVILARPRRPAPRCPPPSASLR
jgi:methylase of polypeptide subunit release factors